MAERSVLIGELAARSGVAPSALRFYESRGLLQSERSPAGQRRYALATLRRVAFIRTAQRVGLTLREIEEALAALPDGRTPTRADWTRLSRSWRQRLEERITLLERLRDDLDGCIGCGCLSLRRCRVWNPMDAAAARGPGPRYLLDGPPPDGGRRARSLPPG
ncbi:MAG TPA: redox-sensitive transcriptional activator SoxR [Candidatus Dormibacteraeota bacterium]|nr:redox-sensitive transcriptional activator SoxR [Candidatus Dormibacteraeota bacterium]